MLNVDIGSLITQKARTTQGRKYLDRGYKVLKKAAGMDSEEFAMAAFYKGKFDLMTEKYSSAALILEQALSAFNDPDTPAQKIELTTHAFLVNAYENLGKKEQATQHCLAIGKMTPKQSKQNYSPVFRVEPKYPRSARRKWVNSWVELIFDVDTAGFVMNPKVTADGRIPEYQSEFNEAAIEAAKGYRYAPSFEDGEPLLTKDVEIRIVFRVVI